jgi:glutathione S-transferase
MVLLGFENFACYVATHGGKSMNFVVHTIPGSPAARAVMATLVEKDASFHVAALAPGAHKVQPHLSRHPFGKMPVLEHDGFVLYETQAILRYLDRILPSPPLTPREPRTAARMDQLMGISDWYLFQGVNNVIGFHRVVGPRVLGLTPDEQAIAAAMPQAHTVFGALSQLLAKKAYLASDDAVTLADLLIAPHMDFLAQTPEWTVLTRDRTNLIDWLARMNDRRSMRLTTWEAVLELAKAS